MTDIHRFVGRIDAELESAPKERHWEIIQARIAELDNQSDRDTAFRLLYLRDSKPGDKVRDDPVVVFVHGIRTRAYWQERLRDAIQTEHKIEAKPIGYGYFSAFQFWAPVGFRSKPIAVISRKLRSIQHESPGRPIVVIVHSFGTYAVVKSLIEDPTIILERLVLCGGVVRKNFRWDRLRNRPQAILNDCGARDVWPIVAQWSTIGFGSSGRHGFKTPEVSDRFHPFTHSDFFSIDFVEQFWIPFLKHGEIVPRR